MNKLSKRGLGVLLAVGAVAAVWYIQQPGDSQTSVTSSTAQGGALAQVAVPNSLTSAAVIGKRAFEAKCAACHGDNAAGKDGLAPALVHKIYEPSHHGDYAFQLAAQNGVRAHHWRFGDMPPVEGVTRADIIGIVTYIRELQRENGIN